MLPHIEIEARSEHHERVRVQVVTEHFWPTGPCLLHFKISRDLTNSNAKFALATAI